MTADRIRKNIRGWKTKSAGGKLAACLLIAPVVVGILFGITGTARGSGEARIGDTSSSAAVRQPSARESASADTEINPLQFVNAEMKNGIDLVRWAESAAENRWGYVMGTFGRVLDDALLNAKLKQYPNEVSPSESFIRSHWVGSRAADCVGLIKGYVWYNADTGTIDYGAHGLPDVDAGGMYDLASVKGAIDTMPDVPGLAVYRMGYHIGVYVGGGQVIHAMDTEHGVVQSRLSDGGWTHWLQVPGVEYDDLLQSCKAPLEKQSASGE